MGFYGATGLLRGSSGFRVYEFEVISAFEVSGRSKPSSLGSVMYACMHGTARHGMAWHGMAWHGMAWHGMAYMYVGVHGKLRLVTMQTDQRFRV